MHSSMYSKIRSTIHGMNNSFNGKPCPDVTALAAGAGMVCFCDCFGKVN